MGRITVIISSSVIGGCGFFGLRGIIYHSLCYIHGFIISAGYPYPLQLSKYVGESSEDLTSVSESSTEEAIRGVLGIKILLLWGNATGVKSRKSTTS